MQADTPDVRFQRFLGEFCHNCHGEQKPKAGINLAAFTRSEQIHRDPKLWETVWRQVSDREMPPKNKPQPDEADREEFLTFLKSVLDNPDPALVPKDPGYKPPHRLNHTEYQNTIRDLLGVEYPASEKFPADGGGGGGFDNNASTLFLPPLLLERYLEAAEEIVAQASEERVHLVKPGLLTSERSAAAKSIRRFCERAFRHPVSDEEQNRFTRIYIDSREQGDSHDAALRGAFRAILVSPHFLFRIEGGASDSTEPRPLNDYELASRLSYFLWSSMPDNELFRLAERKQLNRPEILSAQVERMLRDSKARAFTESFVSQWLHVRDLFSSARPDPKRFPQYSDAVRDAMYREPIELFHFIVSENRSLLELLDADYSFLNEELAKLYGIENIQGSEFRRVTLNNPNRGGVMTMPGPLTLTSYSLRTSPVLRGKWILEEILGTPPPPPPPAVATLPADDRKRDGLTLRQRLEQHREKPQCYSCHQKMDPLGFALENFDPIGRWRTEVAGESVDASGELPGGEVIASPAELKAAILKRREQFVRHLAEKMLAYALGRGLEYYDIPVVKKITDTVIKENYNAQTLLNEVVRSYPFQYRRGQEIEVSQK